MNEPKKPYRPPAIRSTYDGAILGQPPPIKTLEAGPRAWTVATWLIVCAALALGACGGAAGVALAFLIGGGWP